MLTAAPDDEARIARLSQVIRFQTVSKPELRDLGAFEAFHAFLRQSFPSVFGHAALETVGAAGWVLTFQGSDASLAPAVLMAHQDVVPVEPGTDAQWLHPAWSGDVAEGFVWGRGALDDKAAVLAIFETLESALKRGWAPRRTLVLVLDDEEEVGAASAEKAAAILRARYPEAFVVLDEGMAVTEGIVKGMTRRAAFIGIAEKGFLDVELSVASEGGHSSTPPQHTAIGILADAITRVEAAQFDSRLGEISAAQLEVLAPYLPAGQRAAISMKWLIGASIVKNMASTPATAASLRTTIAVTRIEGGIKDNVLPTSAKALVNLRLMPGDTIAAAMEHLKTAIHDDRVQVRRVEGVGSEASPVSSMQAPGFLRVRDAVAETFPDAVVAPGLVLGATSSRFLASWSKATVRFVPWTMKSEELVRTHGANERLAVADYLEGLRFYEAALKALDAP